MPTGPQGQKRPASTNACAIMTAKIATGEIEEQPVDQTKRKAGSAGGRARTKALTKERRKEIAQKASATRWEKQRKAS